MTVRSSSRLLRILDVLLLLLEFKAVQEVLIRRETIINDEGGCSLGEPNAKQHVSNGALDFVFVIARVVTTPVVGSLRPRHDIAINEVHKLCSGLSSCNLSPRLVFLGTMDQFWTCLSLILAEQKIFYPAQYSP